MNTLVEEGDHLNILFITHEAGFPGCIVPARPIGVLDMHDEKGRDQKILGGPDSDPRFRDIIDILHVASHFQAEIEHFFQVYKTLEEKETELVGWFDSKKGEADCS